LVDNKFGGGTLRVLVGACRLAAKEKKPGIWTDDVLRSLTQLVAELRAVRSFPPATVAFHRDYVVGDPAVPLPAALDWEVEAVLRVAHWKVLGFTNPDGSRPPRPWWEAETVAAVRAAAALAAARGQEIVGRNHLLEALLSFPGNRARHYLERSRVDQAMLDQAMRRRWPVTDSEPPTYALAEFLQQTGVLVDPSRPQREGKGRWMARMVRRVNEREPLLVGLELQAKTEAVRLGHAAVGLPHLLLAIMTLEAELAATGLRPLAVYAKANTAILEPLGVTHDAAIRVATPVPAGTPLAPPQKRRPWHGGRGDPRWTASAARVSERAGGSAGSVGLLRSVLSDEDDSGRRFLAALGIQPAIVETELDRLALS
jgi:Clp amino terminal domain, pathogenicity island component